MSRPGWDPHRVDPSRRGHLPSRPEHRAGYQAGRGDMLHPSDGGTGGIPPRKTGCPLKLLLLALLPLLVLAGLLRHRAPEPAGEPLGRRRDDPRHNAGDWQLDGGGREPLPPEQQDGQRRPLRAATIFWALALCAIVVALAGAR